MLERIKNKIVKGTTVKSIISRRKFCAAEYFESTFRLNFTQYFKIQIS